MQYDFELEILGRSGAYLGAAKCTAHYLADEQGYELTSIEIHDAYGDRKSYRVCAKETDPLDAYLWSTGNFFLESCTDDLDEIYAELFPSESYADEHRLRLSEVV